MITRGTTPTLEFVLPFEADTIATGYVVFQQKDTTIIEKPVSACSCAENIISVTLTQKESLSLNAGSYTEISVVVVTHVGERLESDPFTEYVADTAKDGVI